MAGYIDSVSASLRTLIGWPRRDSALASTADLPPQTYHYHMTFRNFTQADLSEAGKKAWMTLPVELRTKLERTMSTGAVVVPAGQIAAKEDGFVRFIDRIGSAFVKAEPTVNQVAADLEPVLAFTPFGPEYDLAVNALYGIEKTAAASKAAGTELTASQKLAMAVQQVEPALNAILKAKGVSGDTRSHVENWVNLIYLLLSGPAGTPSQDLERAIDGEHHEVVK
jgi:hypothetical protein